MDHAVHERFIYEECAVHAANQKEIANTRKRSHKLVVITIRSADSSLDTYTHTVTDSTQ